LSHNSNNLLIFTSTNCTMNPIRSPLRVKEQQQLALHKTSSSVAPILKSHTITRFDENLLLLSSSSENDESSETESVLAHKIVIETTEMSTATPAMTNMSQSPTSPFDAFDMTRIRDYLPQLIAVPKEGGGKEGRSEDVFAGSNKKPQRRHHRRNQFVFIG